MNPILDASMYQAAESARLDARRPLMRSRVAAAGATELATELTGLAAEAAMSRLFAGVHYRFDDDIGLELGRQVARYAMAEDRAGRLLPRWR